MERLTPEEIAEFREIFNLVDRDGGGTITKVELAELMDTLGIDVDPEEIEHMISEIDQGKALIIIWSSTLSHPLFSFPMIGRWYHSL